MKRRLPVILLASLTVLAVVLGLTLRQPSAEGNDYPRLDLPVRGPVLVVLAHPDDETVGAGGLLAELARAGAPCSFVFLTNGEAFQWSVEQENESLLLTPTAYVAYGVKRQEEVRRALADLGQEEAPVYFLGYPDRGLKPLFLQHRSPSDPYLSDLLGGAASPYPNAYSHPVFAGENVLADLQRILRITRPALVITHSSFDTHPDHWATEGFLLESLARLAEEPDFQQPQRLEFLVHRGNWPGQVGKETAAGLFPPYPLRYLKDNWTLFPLSEEAQARKERAIHAYATQLTVMNDYLFSFLRANELFLRPFPEGTRSWEEPVRDTLWRTLFGGADFQEVSMDWQERGLRIGLTTAGGSPANVSLDLDLLLLYPEGSTIYSIHSGDLTSCPTGSSLVRDGNRFLLWIPLDRSPDWAMLGASSRYAATNIDQTALWRIALTGNRTPPSPH
ncbi:MAG: PIG-L family deacetylase [Coprothermobacterota bacterium]|nr:PIG-L family deacetylase [Coprothermobacterota bacterium]